MYFGATDLILPAHVSIGTNTTPLNLGQVGSMIAEVQGELDAAIAAAGYAVPITSPASGGPTVGYAQVVGIAKKGVTARVLEQIFPNLPGGPGSQTSIVTDYRKDYQDALAAIRDGKLPVVGATADSSGTGRELPRSYSTSNTGASSGIVSQAQVGMEF